MAKKVTKTAEKPKAAPKVAPKPAPKAVKPAVKAKAPEKTAKVKLQKPLTKDQIVGHLAVKLDTTKKLAEQFLGEFVNLAYKEAKKEFIIPGLGKLVVAKRKKRIGMNPKTQEKLTIPAKNVLKFKISKTATDAVFGK